MSLPLMILGHQRDICPSISLGYEISVLVSLNTTGTMLPRDKVYAKIMLLVRLKSNSFIHQPVKYQTQTQDPPFSRITSDCLLNSWWSVGQSLGSSVT